MNFLITGNKMKDMKIFVVVSVSIFLSVIGCTDNEIELTNRTYSIENDTDFIVDVKFYNKIDNGLNNQTSKILNSRGEILAKQIQKIPVNNFSEELPTSAFIADSVKVIINENKFFTFTYDFDDDTFSEPINRNIFRHSNYENLGDERYLFKITQQDYENAEDCNGNCD
jgi:hypothetical protein